MRQLAAWQRSGFPLVQYCYKSVLIMSLVVSLSIYFYFLKDFVHKYLLVLVIVKGRNETVITLRYLGTRRVMNNMLPRFGSSQLTIYGAIYKLLSH